MKTAEEIQERIDHIKTLGKGLGINQKRISELEWVLNDKKAKKYRYTQAQTEWPKDEKESRFDAQGFCKECFFSVQSCTCD
jgi:hypothetical protein